MQGNSFASADPPVGRFFCGILPRMKLSEILKERGYVYQHSAPLEEITDGKKRVLYLGVDPTADSMHVGQLQGLLVLRRFVDDGHKVIIVIGGGTGMVGDPGGKSAERNLLDDVTVVGNARALKAQFSTMLGLVDFEMVNNADWLHPLNYMEFLRDIGKHFTVNEMIKRDSVRPRIEAPDQSISYTEFSYMLLQAYDFLQLHIEKKCDLQVGGSDQWGNIVSGVDLIRKKTGDTAYAFSWPLLVDKKTQKKFGKSEGNAVWLDATKTSPFQFYQFWLNVEDDMVEELLLKMTLLPRQEIDVVMESHHKSAAERLAQKRLAREVAKHVHGEGSANISWEISGTLFGGDLAGRNIETLSIEALEKLKQEAPNCTVKLGDSIVDVVVAATLASSKREAKQFIEDGAISLNGGKVTSTERVIMKEDFQNSPAAILKRGKRNVSVLTL